MNQNQLFASKSTFCIKINLLYQNQLFCIKINFLHQNQLLTLTCRPDSSFCIVPHLCGLLVFDGEGINWQSSSFMWSDKSELNCGGCNLISDSLLQTTRLTGFLQFNFVKRFTMGIDSLQYKKQNQFFLFIKKY